MLNAVPSQLAASMALNAAFLSEVRAFQEAWAAALSALLSHWCRRCQSHRKGAGFGFDFIKDAVVKSARVELVLDVAFMVMRSTVAQVMKAAPFGGRHRCMWHSHQRQVAHS